MDQSAPQPPPTLNTQSVNSQSNNVNIRHHILFSFVGLVILVLVAGLVYWWQHDKVKSLNAEVSSLNSQVASLNSQVSSLKGKPSTSNSNSTSVSSSSTPKYVAGASCQSSQLSLSLDKYLGSVMQQPGAYFKLTNTSDVTCILMGYPTFTAYTSSGEQIFPGETTNGSSYLITDPKPSTVTLSPSVNGYFGVGWADVNNTSGQAGSNVGCLNMATVKTESDEISTSVSGLAQVCPVPNGSAVFEVSAIGTKSSFGSPSSP